jgi:hypothetical protein
MPQKPYGGKSNDLLECIVDWKITVNSFLRLNVSYNNFLKRITFYQTLFTWQTSSKLLKLSFIESLIKKKYDHAK